MSFLINVGSTVADEVSAALHYRQFSACSPVCPGTQSGLQGTGLLRDNPACQELALKLQHTPSALTDFCEIEWQGQKPLFLFLQNEQLWQSPVAQ